MRAMLHHPKRRVLCKSSRPYAAPPPISTWLAWVAITLLLVHERTTPPAAQPLLPSYLPRLEVLPPTALAGHFFPIAFLLLLNVAAEFGAQTAVRRVPSAPQVSVRRGISLHTNRVRGREAVRVEVREVNRWDCSEVRVAGRLTN